MIALALAVILAAVALAAGVAGVAALVGVLLLPVAALGALVDGVRSFHRGRTARRRGR